MIFKKYTSFNIGTMLLLVDCFSVLMAFVVFDVTTGLFSTLGLIGKSLMIDGVIENINLCKCFNIVCDNPEPICDFIIKELNRSATVYQAQDYHAPQPGCKAEKLYPPGRADCIYADLQLQRDHR